MLSAGSSKRKPSFVGSRKSSAVLAKDPSHADLGTPKEEQKMAYAQKNRKAMALKNFVK